MQETWQVSLKRELTDIYVQTPQEWTDINISTSGLLNLTIISDRFKELSLPQRKEEVYRILHKFKISPGFISLYTVEEARYLDLSAPQLTHGSSVQTWQDLALWRQILKINLNPLNLNPAFLEQ
ncbi:hypothetical protein [Microcoleus sp. OTE_8_concoct_300]|uniref:hypothetical protein n=1 Tax=Microcoleus sp. OTE_8_concoct_300 TaxID=2964710 RepID=UPI00403F3EDF